MPYNNFFPSSGYYPTFRKLTVENNVAVTASPNIITTQENGKVFHNKGATAENYHTLPPAKVGLFYGFYCQDADGIRATAVGTDTISAAASVSAAAGYINSTTVGSFIWLACLEDGSWVTLSLVGTWGVT